MSKFQVVIPVLNQHDVTRRCVQSWIDLAKDRIDILFIDNGSDTPLSDTDFFKSWSSRGLARCVRNDQNTGVYPTFQQGFDSTEADFVFYSHNDVEMLEFGWDVKLDGLLTRLAPPLGPKAGVCGMFGAKGIGTPDLYREPYHFTQLMRWGCVTVEGMHDHTNELIQSDHDRIMVLDGFSLIVSRQMVNDAMGGKFDHSRFPPHHMYDIDICVTSHYGGYYNYALDVDCVHHGGATSTHEQWAEKMGSTDLKIHRKAHEIFYEKWRGKLPIGVR